MLGIAKGNALKYRLRAGFKDPSKLEEDINKSNWYRRETFEVFVSQPTGPSHPNAKIKQDTNNG